MRGCLCPNYFYYGLAYPTFLPGCAWCCICGGAISRRGGGAGGNAAKSGGTNGTMPPIGNATANFCIPIVHGRNQPPPACMPPPAPYHASSITLAFNTHTPLSPITEHQNLYSLYTTCGQKTEFHYKNYNIERNMVEDKTIYQM